METQQNYRGTWASLTSQAGREIIILVGLRMLAASVKHLFRGISNNTEFYFFMWWFFYKCYWTFALCQGPREVPQELQR